MAVMPTARLSPLVGKAMVLGKGWGDGWVYMGWRLEVGAVSDVFVPQEEDGWWSLSDWSLALVGCCSCLAICCLISTIGLDPVHVMFVDMLALFTHSIPILRNLTHSIAQSSINMFGNKDFFIHLEDEGYQYIKVVAIYRQL
jgi:hypothetical protein